MGCGRCMEAGEKQTVIAVILTPAHIQIPVLYIAAQSGGSGVLGCDEAGHGKIMIDQRCKIAGRTDVGCISTQKTHMKNISF